MKLRNKKTGVHGEYKVISAGYLIGVKDCNSDEAWQYDCLAGFNEDWEDYKPAEPLIKDPKIRRSVRAWAEIGKYEHIYYDRAYNRLADDYDFLHCIEFAIDPCPDAESGRCYTLTELCGEEEKEEDLRDEEY